MKHEKKARLTLVWETVAQRLVSGSHQHDQPKPESMVSGLVIRTQIKAGTALLLQQQAAAGAAAGGGGS